jgi:TolA-binding protein
MPRPNDDLLKTAERRRDVLQLREAGATYEAIADALREKYGADRLPSGWDSLYAAKDVKRELKKVQRQNAETAESVREIELRRLDRMLRGLWPDAVQGDTQAIDRVLRIMKRRADLLGLDAPERFEQAVSFAESDDYQEARTEMMQALQDFPEARAAAADALAGGEENG